MCGVNLTIKSKEHYLMQRKGGAFNDCTGGAWCPPPVQHNINSTIN